MNRKTSDQGDSPLLLACQFSMPTVVRALIDNGADVNDADNSGYTALHLAALNNNTDEIAMLLAAKATTINKVDFKGETPIYLAVANSNYDAAKALIQAKADATIPDKDGKTALKVAQDSNQDGIVKLLTEYLAGAK